MTPTGHICRCPKRHQAMSVRCHLQHVQDLKRRPIVLRILRFIDGVYRNSTRPEADEEGLQIASMKQMHPRSLYRPSIVTWRAIKWGASRSSTCRNTFLASVVTDCILSTERNRIVVLSIIVVHFISSPFIISWNWSLTIWIATLSTPWLFL